MESRFAALGALTGFALGALAFAGCDCSPSSVCRSGAAGCACIDGTTCASGLECVMDRCLDPSTMDAGPVFIERDAGPPYDAAPNPDAFFQMDPPPEMCNEDGSRTSIADPPGGTPECPDDKNREGCPCTQVGETAACWPGLRANRNRGICHDGVTTCNPFNEFTGTWGPCEGAVLPVDGVVRGPQACSCFSMGRWEIENLSPCFIQYSGGEIYAVSTNSTTGQCGAASGPPPTAPTPIWSADYLTVDCEGRFNLCYTLKAGNAETASPSDCMVARVCTGEFWYETRNVRQALPDLASWVGADPACAADFMNNGGYGEMSVVGLSVECDEIDDGSGGEYVFNRVNYCSITCAMNPNAPGCENCQMGGSGDF